MGSQQFCLRWNNHQSNMVDVFDELLTDESFVDVTLACEGNSLKAHKIILSACSSFFKMIFKDNPCQHPIVILQDIKYENLKAILNFMYRGEVNVSQNQLNSLLRTAESLKIKGLADANKAQDTPDFDQSADNGNTISDMEQPYIAQSVEANIAPVPAVQQDENIHRNKRKSYVQQHNPPVPASNRRAKLSHEKKSPIPIETFDNSLEEIQNIKQESNESKFDNNHQDSDYAAEMSQTVSMAKNNTISSMSDMSTMEHSHFSSITSDQEPPMSDPSYSSPNVHDSENAIPSGSNYTENLMMSYQDSSHRESQGEGSSKLYDISSLGYGQIVLMEDYERLLGRKRKIRNSWHESDMEKALEAINNKGWNLPRAVKTFNVPLTTLWRRVKLARQDIDHHPI